MTDYSVFTDEKLAELSRSDGNALESLIKRYKKAVISVARRYYLSGGEKDDLVQEGTIGLFKAITTFDKDRSDFKNYAFTCIKSSIISSVRRSTSNKNKPLNNYLSISADDDNDKNPVVKGEIPDPAEELINAEAAAEFYKDVKSVLSEYEYVVLEKYLQGFSYQAIAKELGTTAKSVDNAFQRTRKKIAKLKIDGGK